MRKKIFYGLLTLFLCVMLSPLVIYAQDRTLKGMVQDGKGNGLPGATITEKISKISTKTDFDGRFTIKVPASAKTLIISYVGMKEQEIAIGNSTEINTTLTTSASNLDDVVVIGYGTAKRANLTSAQSSVSSKDMDRTVNTTLEQAIQGRAAGVYITQNSGQPGGGMSVNIRGISSIIGNTEPLYIIDGVQIQGSSVAFGAQSSSNPLAGLNPSDIDNIQILQGPSALAIYGSRATNGVVLITTKRGKSGTSTLTYGFQHSIQTPPKKLDLMNLQQYAQMVKDFHVLAGGETQQEFLDPSLLGMGTDWQEELFKTTPMNKHQISMSGGSDKTTYFLSGEYLNQEGIAAGSGFDRYSFRVNLDNKPREWATIGLNLSFNQTNENLTTSQENVIFNALQLTPQVPVKNLDGTWGGGDITNGANQFAPVNPIAIASLTTNRNKRRQLLGGINLALDIVKGLTFRTSFNTNIGYSNSDYYIPKYKIGWAENATAKLTEGTSTNSYWNWNQLLQYARQFGKHNIDIMVSHEAQESSWKNVGASKTGFLTNEILDLAAGDDKTAGATGGSGPWGMESYLGRISYNYDNRYLITGAFRRDGSSNFGPDNKWGFFPSVSAAWRISQEKFFNVSFISDLKLRIETGISGSQGDFNGYYSPLTAAATPSGTGFLPARFSNPKGKWEETKTDNIGINIGLLQNRISVEFDYYVRKTDNLLTTAILPWYMGTNGNGAVAAPLINFGSLNNKGWSVTINTTNVNNKNFKWESSLNLSVFKTTVTKFNSENGFVDRVSWWLDSWTQRAAVGKAPWLFRGFIEEGLFQSVDEINNSPVPVDNNGERLPTDVDNIWVGDVKYKDISGPKGIPDGIIDVNDQTDIGNPWPKLFGGFTNSFSYKGFDLSVLITSTYGNDIYNFLDKKITNPNNINLSWNLPVKAMDYAKITTKDDGSVALANPGTDVARISYGPNSNYSRITNKFVEDGSFIRLKNVSLSYNVPASLLAKQKVVKGVRLTVGVQNLATITGYKGYDPEVGSYVGRDASNSNQAIGLDYGRYPLTAVYTFNLGVNF